MALRLASKIRCNIIQNLKRSFTVKTENTAAAVQEQKNEVKKSPTQFPVYKLSSSQQNEQKLDKQMQQSTQLDYTKPGNDVSGQTDVTRAYYPELPPLNQNNFNVSKTYANITTALKMPTPINPFPEPVKFVSSHSVSDQEKAELNLAEAKMPMKGYVEAMKDVKVIVNHIQTRNYGKKACSKPRKGKTQCKEDKKKCKKISPPECEPKKTLPEPIKCKKIKAPYPSYSETCPVEVIDKRPTECKIYAWRQSGDIPDFTQKKKKYHTAPANENILASGSTKKPCKRPNVSKPKKKKNKGNTKKRNEKRKIDKTKKKPDDKCKKAMNSYDEEADIFIDQRTIKIISGRQKKPFIDVKNSWETLEITEHGKPTNVETRKNKK